MSPQASLQTSSTLLYIVCFLSYEMKKKHIAISSSKTFKSTVHHSLPLYVEE